MGWETRQRGGRYFTRSRRQDGRIIREYIGFEGSEAATRAAWEMGQRSAAKARTQEALTAARERCQRADLALADYCAAIEGQFHAALTSAGYHQHDRGEWRLRRGYCTSSAHAGARSDVR